MSVSLWELSLCDVTNLSHVSAKHIHQFSSLSKHVKGCKLRAKKGCLLLFLLFLLFIVGWITAQAGALDAAQRRENVNNIRCAGVGCEKQSANGAGETCEIAPRLSRLGAFLTSKKKSANCTCCARQSASRLPVSWPLSRVECRSPDVALTSIMCLLYMKQKETGGLPSEKSGLNFLALVFIIY